MLTDELVEPPRPNTVRKRRDLIGPQRRRIAEEVAHAASMLGAVVVTPTTPIVTRISVVHLYVRDVRRSLDFYRDLLEIPLEGNDRWVEAELGGGSRFALHAAHEGVGEPSSGTVHVDFEVDDIDAAIGRLREGGVDVGETMREEWGTAVEVTDPDGYRIFLFDPPGPP
jgi:lactoylglutathione lyase